MISSPTTVHDKVYTTRPNTHTHTHSLLSEAYLLSNEEVVDKADGCDCNALFLAEHGTDAEAETEGEPGSCRQS